MLKKNWPFCRQFLTILQTLHFGWWCRVCIKSLQCFCSMSAKWSIAHEAIQAFGGRCRVCIMVISEPCIMVISNPPALWRCVATCSFRSLPSLLSLPFPLRQVTILGSLECLHASGGDWTLSSLHRDTAIDEVHKPREVLSDLWGALTPSSPCLFLDGWSLKLLDDRIALVVKNT